MKDLKSQLAAALGVEPPPDEPEPLAHLQRAEPRGPDEVPILAEGAWRDDPWAVALKQLLPSMTGAPSLPVRASLGAQRQVTDQLVKLLKKAGRRREARELADLRDTWFSKRDKAAWTAVKVRMGELELSDKAYRRLKQEEAEPVRILERLERQGAALQGASAKRVAEALGG